MVCAIPPVDQATTKLGWGAGRFVALPVEQQSAYPARFADPDRWRIERAEDEYHPGLDFMADEGTPVVAPRQGVVVAKGYDAHAEWRPTYGHWVVVLHGDNPVLYAHLRDAATLDVGANVATGDLLGYVGNSGLPRSARPRLYFAVRETPCVEGTSCYAPTYFPLFRVDPAVFFSRLGIDLVGARVQPLVDYAETPPFGQQLVPRAGGPSDPAVCQPGPLAGPLASTQSPVYRRFGQSSLSDSRPYRPRGGSASGGGASLPVFALGAAAVLWWLFRRSL